MMIKIVQETEQLHIINQMHIQVLFFFRTTTTFKAPRKKRHAQWSISVEWWLRDIHIPRLCGGTNVKLSDKQTWNATLCNEV